MWIFEELLLMNKWVLQLVFQVMKIKEFSLLAARFCVFMELRNVELQGQEFIHSAISIAPLQVLYYSEALPTTARILYRSFTPKRTGNCR